MRARPSGRDSVLAAPLTSREMIKQVQVKYRDRGGPTSLNYPRTLQPQGSNRGRTALVVMLPNGSSNSIENGRADTAGFLERGLVCPVGYEPGKRSHNLWLPGRPDFRFISGRPQNMPMLAAQGQIDLFVSFADVVDEARAAGVDEIEHLLDLPFAVVDLVVVVKDDAPFADISNLIVGKPAPITCLSEMPFMTGKTLAAEESYVDRFGMEFPVIQYEGVRLAGGCDGVEVVVSAGSSEVEVKEGFYDCAVVIRSTGDTITECKLRVIKTVGTYRPALFCRAGLRENTAVAEQLGWFIGRLEVAKRKWNERSECKQLELQLLAAERPKQSTENRSREHIGV